MSFVALGLWCAMAMCFAGCGGDGENRAAVHGTVTLDGQPVENGSILFTPIEETKGQVAGGPIQGGRFQLDEKVGAAVGWNRVEIRAQRKTGKMVQKPFAPVRETIPEQVEAVPARYNSESTLRFEVKPGDNLADFQVTSK